MDLEALLNELETNELARETISARNNELRRMIAERAGNLKEGPNYAEIDGVRVKITQPINRTINQDRLRALIAADPEKPWHTLFKLKYELVLAGWKAAPEAQKFLADVVTEKLGLPHVERAK